MASPRSEGVCLFPLYLLNPLTLELEFVCEWVITIARLALKVNVIGQGQRLMSSAYGRGNAVTRSIWPRSLIEDSFSSTNHLDPSSRSVGHQVVAELPPELLLALSNRCRQNVKVMNPRRRAPQWRATARQMALLSRRQTELAGGRLSGPTRTYLAASDRRSRRQVRQKWDTDLSRDKNSDVFRLAVCFSQRKGLYRL